MWENKSLGVVGYRFSIRIIRQAAKSAVNQAGTPDPSNASHHLSAV
jgi:hypothetical protein